jgi:hypothetical protein
MNLTGILSVLIHMVMPLLSFPAPPVGPSMHVIADVGILQWATIGEIGAKCFRAKTNDTVAISSWRLEYFTGGAPLFTPFRTFPITSTEIEHKFLVWQTFGGIYQ